MATPRKKAPVGTDPSQVPGDAPVDPVLPPDAAPVAPDPAVADPVAVPVEAPATDVAPAEPVVDVPVVEAPVPGDAPADVASVDPADNQPAIATVPALPDPSGAAAAVLERDVAQPVTVTVPSRAEVAAQQVIDEGTLTPAQPGSAIHPVETLDGHTVDPSGTADDHMPGVAAVSDPGDTSLSTPAPVPDTSAKGPGTGDVAAVSFVFTALAEAYAEQGVHKDLLSAAIDTAYANLQGQRSSAQFAGQPDPFPLLAV